MKFLKRIILTVLPFMATFIVPTRPVQGRSLTFGNDGEFKIMQLTDLHLNGHYPGECGRVYDRISYMVGEEHPDFIVITGDIVYSKPARPVISELTAHLDSFGIPWAVVFGNHDAEQDLSRQELSAMYASGRNSLNTLGPDGELADLEIRVVPQSGSDALYCLYLMDSHDYSRIEGLKGYGWFNGAQIEWMRACCKAEKMPDGSPVPALAFFHIPLREYIDAWAPMENPRPEQKNTGTCAGMRGENIAAGALNTGMFAAMKECGNIVGVFVGHDHDNDFVANYQGIALCYGRFSGCDGVYNNIPCGAKFILLKAGERKFETWTRDDRGRVSVHVTTDGHILRKAPSRPKGGLNGQWTDVPE